MKAQDRIELKKDGPRYFLGNVEVGEAEYRTLYPVPAESGSGAGSFVTFKPMASRALKVHPSQVDEARETAKAKGVPTDFTPDGRPIFVSSSHFRTYAKRHGFVHQGYAVLLAVLLAGFASAAHAPEPTVVVTTTVEPARPCDHFGIGADDARRRSYDLWQEKWELEQVLQIARWLHSEKACGYDAEYVARLVVAVEAARFRGAAWSRLYRAQCDDNYSPYESEFYEIGTALDAADQLKAMIGPEAFDAGRMP